MLFLFFLFSGAQNLWRHSRIPWGKVHILSWLFICLVLARRTFHCGIVHILVMIKFQCVGQVLPSYQNRQIGALDETADAPQSPLSSLLSPLYSLLSHTHSPREGVFVETLWRCCHGNQGCKSWSWDGRGNSLILTDPKNVAEFTMRSRRGETWLAALLAARCVSRCSAAPLRSYGYSLRVAPHSALCSLRRGFPFLLPMRFNCLWSARWHQLRCICLCSPFVLHYNN